MVGAVVEEGDAAGEFIPPREIRDLLIMPQGFGSANSE